MKKNIKTSNAVDKQELKIFILLLLPFLFFLITCISVMILKDYSFSLFTFIVCLIIAIYIADLISGIFHLLVDYTPLKKSVGWDSVYYYEGNKGSKEYLKLRNKVMKKAGIWQSFSYVFKMHHFGKPNHIAKRPVYTTFVPTLVPSIILFIISLLLMFTMNISFAPISLAFCLSGIIIFWAQYIHSVTHGRKTHSVVKTLQKYRILMTIKHHVKHHKYPDKYFCFINGWADPLLNQLVKILFYINLLNKESLSIPKKEH